MSCLITLFYYDLRWAINSAMILLAAATFFKSGIQVEELQQAKSLLEPLLGSNAAIVFALALLMAGISSTITSGMAAGSIFAGIFGESYHIQRQPLAGRSPFISGNCLIADFLYWRSFQRIDYFADDT